MQNESERRDQQAPRPACPVCGGELIEIRAKLQCARWVVAQFQFGWLGSNEVSPQTL